MIFKRSQLPYDHTVPFQGKKLNYRVLGNPKNSPVILVHGAMESRDWDEFEKLISQHYLTYVLDLPGFGASDNLSGKYSIETLSESLCTFITQMSFESVPIIALSMGTLVAVQTAVNGCSRGKIVLGGMPFAIENKKVGLVNKAPLFLKRLALKFDVVRKKVLIPLLDETLNETYTTNSEDKLARMKSTHENTISDIDLTKEAELNITNFYPKMKNRHILLYGEKDPLQFTAQKHHLKFTIISGAEHNLYRTNPKETLKVVLDFLK